ncbi:type I-F CRISPR-associated protein Csy1 [Serratia sp. UGAL515B_01]|uniref:type I-F CRISPR-associated protein Csy1 n=1 Tax=Serratia sp. UGAL515B_01 TaxID=2986763 RepID=UPI002955A2F4|nr:type I-F CRISPR-associated protein Csy1 [Serratia sp. UGAL515B_01]WON78431.1 type I-F CRISPR-associated protein Csy1 [Serratia sp. UGAL515B_01]
MEYNEFSRIIVSYIESRRQPKLEAFDKEAEKKLAGLTDSDQFAVTQQDIAQQRRELEQRYEVCNWLTDAASRAGQINLVTHALKFTHSDAKGSSIFLPAAPQDLAYLSTTTLRNPAIDAVGNAAALDVAKLLQMEYEGETLIAYLNRGDYSPLAALAESEQQLQQWVNGFKQVLTDKQPSSHKLAKQLYFPVGSGEYHLLSPLFSSSLAHALHQRITDTRFSDAAKEIYSAFKAHEWHSAPRVSYPNTAVQNIGGTKPQNISYLNSVRGGRTWLLSCAPPSWKVIPKPPTQHKSIFHDYSDFSQMARSTIWQLREYLLSVKQLDSTKAIRDRRLAFTDEIIDTLFNYVATVQNLDVQACWSAEEGCKLKRSQPLWLDAGRVENDENFKFEREGGDWQKEIARDFGEWLNRRLQHEELKFGEVERREWSTAKLFKQRLREFEQDLKEGLV